MASALNDVVGMYLSGMSYRDICRAEEMAYTKVRSIIIGAGVQRERIQSRRLAADRVPRTFRLNSEGYIVFKRYSKTILAHRFIMETHLGRTLSADDVVHHKNGIRTDNRIENLEVIKRGEHSTLHRKSYLQCLKCSAIVKARGLCIKHYNKAFRDGTYKTYTRAKSAFDAINSVI